MATDPSHTPVYKAVTLTAVGAECLENVEEGDALSFLYRRGEKFFLSEPSSAFPDSAVYWDAMSVQTCRMEEHKKKYLKLFVQKVPVGPDGLPADFGTLLTARLSGRSPLTTKALRPRRSRGDH
jgi:hypothetical protein